MAYKKAPAKKAAKEAKPPKPKRESVGNRSAIPSLVLDGLRQDVSKADDEATFVSDYLRQDPVTGYVSTGSFLLDSALGYPKGFGFPLPSIVEIVGSESTGKSSLAYAVMANIQRMGGWANLIDAEGMFTREYAILAGLDLSKEVFGYAQMSRLETAMTTIRRTVERHYALAPDMPLAVVLDSVAGCTVAAEQEKEGDVARALHARILARELRSGITGQMYTKVNADGEDLLIGRPLIMMFINQMKSTMATNPYQQQMDSFGGKGLKYHARVRIQLERKQVLWEKDKESSPSGFRCHVKILKNKVTSPYREVDFDFKFDSGIEDYFPVLNFMEDHDAIEKSGNRFVWKDRTYYPNAFRDFLKANPDEWLAVRQQCLLAIEKAWGKNSLAITPPAVGDLELHEE